MTISAGTPKYAIELARRYVEQESEKKLFGGRYVRFGPLLGVFGYLLQEGAVLGHAYRSDPIPFLTAYYADGDKVNEALSYVRREATELIDPVLESASSLYELAVLVEMRTMGDSGEWAAWVAKHANSRLPVDEATRVAWVYAVRGAGFGLANPGAFEELFAKTYRKIDVGDWREMRKYGVVDSAEQTAVTLVQEEADAKAAFEQYCALWFPTLLKTT